MSENRIRALRKSRGLTQRQLAEKIGTSQQQIQRIEAGVHAARLDLAVKLATALEVNVRDVFPKLPSPKKSSGRRTRRPEDEDQELVNAGIDPDPKIWTLKFFMFDGRILFFRVPSNEKDRIESIIAGGRKQFLVFDSMGNRVALNHKKVGACQFLFDMDLPEKPEEEDELKVTIHFVSTPEIITFDAEPDDCPLEEDEYGRGSQLQYLFVLLDGALGEEDGVVEFDDIDGETVYLRMNELLVIEVPLICCEPALLEASVEGFEEDDEEAVQPKGGGDS